MDLLASILTYLGTVTAIIVAAVMSFDAFVYTPLHAVNPQHTLTVEAKPSVVKPRAAKAAALASASKITLAHAPAAAFSDGPQMAKAAPQIDVAAERRAAFLRREARQKRLRNGLARQTGEREWASQQAPNALGYASAPSGGLFDEFPYR
jgi:hypothetical protein